ncbi:MAG: hypothetical protein ACREMQ_02675 [Longimicrobiales bacterium]
MSLTEGVNTTSQSTSSAPIGSSDVAHTATALPAGLAAGFNPDSARDLR